MPAPYPLAQVLDIKRRRVDEAEKNVKLKEESLRKELQILEEKKAARDKVQQHHDDKLRQLRNEMDTGTTTEKITQGKVYLKVCQEKVIIENKKVAEQQEQVELAERNVEVAKQELKKRRTDVDKFVNHRKDWLKDQQKEIAIQEERDEDELGSLMHNLRKRKGY